jgi:predicted AlkP superfamily pyrophosphatase or phosphodiesterase
VGDLISFFTQRGVSVAIVSEYGITDVNRAIHLNRMFRQNGWLAIKDELGLEMLDAGASSVFAVADHQVAHVYLRNSSLEKRVTEMLENDGGVQVLGAREKHECGIDHERAGDLIAVAPQDAWFTYYYWLDDLVAPDFARCVDIHRKPGYDPVELFLDPKLKTPKLKIAGKLLKKKLGLRMLMDVIPLDASLVRGSHGIRTADSKHHPVFVTNRTDLLTADNIAGTDVYHLIRRAVLGGTGRVGAPSPTAT